MDKGTTVTTTKMMEDTMENSYIEEDRFMRSCPVYPYDNIRKLETVITKEEFLMCYKAWVKGSEVNNDGRN